jgi:hypothetical protein
VVPAGTDAAFVISTLSIFRFPTSAQVLGESARARGAIHQIATASSVIFVGFIAGVPFVSVLLGPESLLAVFLEAEIFAEERHHVILEAICDGAGVCARVNLKAVHDSVVVEDIVQLGCIEAQAVLIAHIHGDGAILL